MFLNTTLLDTAKYDTPTSENHKMRALAPPRVPKADHPSNTESDAAHWAHTRAMSHPPPDGKNQLLWQAAVEKKKHDAGNTSSAAPL